MGLAVSIIIILMAAFAVGATLYIVMQEKHVHEEHYIPGMPGADDAPQDNEPKA